MKQFLALQLPAALPSSDIISESTQTDDSDSFTRATAAAADNLATTAVPFEVELDEEDDSSETGSVIERLSRRVREGMGLWDERQDRSTQVGRS